MDDWLLTIAYLLLVLNTAIYAYDSIGSGPPTFEAITANSNSPMPDTSQETNPRLILVATGTALFYISIWLVKISVLAFSWLLGQRVVGWWRIMWWIILFVTVIAFNIVTASTDWHCLAGSPNFIQSEFLARFT